MISYFISHEILSNHLEIVECNLAAMVLVSRESDTYLVKIRQKRREIIIRIIVY